MFGLFPSSAGFHELFEEGAMVLEKAAKCYTQLVSDYGHAREHLEAIRKAEHEGDSVARRTFAKLDTTFITPFDREDIQDLTTQVDNIIDSIDASAQRILLFGIQKPPEALIRQTMVLLDACVHVRQAIILLRRLKKPEEIRKHLIEIHNLENRGDDINHKALADLFNGVTHPNPLEVMKLKEIYDYTEVAIDCCEDASNVIERIILKNL